MRLTERAADRFRFALRFPEEIIGRPGLDNGHSLWQIACGASASKILSRMGLPQSAGSRHVPSWNTDPAGGQENMRAISSPGWRASCPSPRTSKRANLQRSRAGERYCFSFRCNAHTVVFLQSRSHTTPFDPFGSEGVAFFSKAGQEIVCRPGRKGLAGTTVSVRRSSEMRGISTCK